MNSIPESESLCMKALRSVLLSSCAFCAVLSLFLCCSFMPEALNAQITGQGAVSGTVTDPTGAAIPKAKVAVTNVATNVTTTRLATGTGYYTVSPLPPGQYVVTVTATGFAKLRQEHVTVDALQVTTVNPVLQVGTATETVNVTTAPPPLQTANATLGDVIENKTYSELPVAMSSGTPRDPTAFASLANGVQSGGRSGNFDGTNANENEMYVEGVPLTTVDSQGDNRKLNENLSVDAVDQTQVQTSGTGAQYQGVGVENFSIKQGTNQFHGSAYLFLRNTVLDTWNFFAKGITVPTATGAKVQEPKPIDHQTELSLSLGGPVIHNKLFFFGNYDRYHYRSIANPTLQTIPTLAARKGDFSAYPTKIYDPSTLSVCTAANGGTPCVYQFMGDLNGVPTPNVIPQSEMSPTMLKLMANLPTPTNDSLSNNYLYARPTGNDNWEFTGRMDWNLTPTQAISLISTNGDKDFAPCDYGSTSVLPYPYTNCTNVTELTTTDIVKHTWTLSPHMVNQLRYGYTRFWAPIQNLTQGDKTFSTGALGIGNVPAGQASSTAPGVSFSGGIDTPSGFSAPSGYHEAVNTYTIADDLTWAKGHHNFTFGGDFQFLQFNQSVADSASKPISFKFSNTSTAGFKGATLDTSTGLPFASYLIGAVDSASVYTQNFSTLGARYKAFSPYVQDDWKVTRNLTLNLGLRWDLYTPFREVNDRWSTFDPTVINPATGTKGALVYIGHGAGTCNCDSPVHTHYSNFGPRVGFAYQYTSHDVVRGSFSIMYTHNGGVGGSNSGNYNGTGQTGLTVTPSFADSEQHEQPAFYLNSAFGNTSIPSYSTTPDLTATANTGNYIDSNGNAVTAGGVNYADPELSGRPPYTESYNFGLQHSFTNNLTISADYVGNQSHFLVAGLRGYYNNELEPKYQVLGSLLNQSPSAIDTTPGPNKGMTYLAEAQAIMPGITLPYSNFGGPSATIGQMLKPFPQYSGVSDTWGDVGNADYNALQLTLKQKSWHGLSYTLNYTWSKTVDDLSIRSRYAIPDNVIDGGHGTAKPYGLDRTISSTDIPNNLKIYGLYALPIGGKGQFGGDHFWVRAIAGGWSTSFIFTKISGGPLSISGQNCHTPDNCEPSYNPAFTGPVRMNGGYGSGVNYANASKIPFINSAAFASNPSTPGGKVILGQPGNYGYNFGNIAREAPYGLYNIGNYNLDMGLRRTFPLYDRLALTFQADGFNMTNHVQFGGIGTSLSSSSFGTVSKQGNGSRYFQLAAKLNF